MRHHTLAGAAALAAVLLGCGSDPMQPVTAVGGEPGANVMLTNFVALGSGEIAVTAPAPAVGTATFSFRASRLPTGEVNGSFHMVRPRAGYTVDFTGDVTCLAVDAATGRAWIGGVVTRNDSNDPNHSAAIHQPGRDVWFRVLDGGAPDGDRSSVYGFEGAAGFVTSADYCAGRPWPDLNANAFEVVSGGIVVQPR